MGSCEAGPRASERWATVVRETLRPEAQGRTGSRRLPARAALPQDSSCLGRGALLKLQCGCRARLRLSTVYLQQDMEASCVSIQKMKFTGLAHRTCMPYTGIHSVRKL